MKKILFLLFYFCFLACENKEINKIKDNNIKEEVIQIEQDDEITQVNANNLPLPVEDELIGFDDSQENLKLSRFLYKQKCAACHGKQGEIPLKTALKDLGTNAFVQRLSLLQNQDKNHNFKLSKEQILNLAKIFSKEN